MSACPVLSFLRLPAGQFTRAVAQIHDNAIKKRGRAEKEATDAEISARAAELAHRDYHSARFSEAYPLAATDRSNDTEDGAAAADAQAAKRRRLDGDAHAGLIGSRFISSFIAMPLAAAALAYAFVVNGRCTDAHGTDV